MAKVRKLLKSNIVYVFFIILALIPLSGFPSYQFYILERGMQNALVVISLVILIGYTGQLSLGHAGLVAVGAYTYSILATNYHVSPWIALAIAPIATGIVGALLGVPSFKLSGPFLVVNTIAFGEIARILILNNEKITGGPFGITGIETVLDGNPLYYLMLVVLFLVVVATLRLSNSRIGLAFKAIKEDEVAAQVMGVDIRRTKLVAFVTSAVLAGLAGVFFANLAGYLNPDSFTFSESATYLLMVVMGGLGNVTGAVFSSTIITALPELLRFMAKSRMVVYALVLLLYLRYSHSSELNAFIKRFTRKKPLTAENNKKVSSGAGK